MQQLVTNVLGPVLPALAGKSLLLHNSQFTELQE